MSQEETQKRSLFAKLLEKASRPFASTSRRRHELARVVRSMVLKGNFMTSRDQRQYVHWRCPKWKLLVFVSSTFTDTQAERNYLMDIILPELRKLGGEYGIDVTFVDMRWGVRDTNTLDHRTWIECSRELERCREESDGLFFLSLQSEKYGYIPLPRTLFFDDFEKCLQKVTESSYLPRLARDWYKLDQNSAPPSYVLKNLKNIKDPTYWNEVLPALLPVFDGVVFENNSASKREYSDGTADEKVPVKCSGHEDHAAADERLVVKASDDADSSDSFLCVGRSVTEWEVKAAIMKEPSADASRAFWLHREFDGGVPKTFAKYVHFHDVYDNDSSKAKYHGLKNWMNEHFQTERKSHFTEATFDDYNSRSADWTSQFDEWGRQAFEVLRTSLREIIEQRKAWNRDGCGLGLPGEELAEMLHHAAWAREKVLDFVGREELIAEALRRVFSPIGSRILGNNSSSSGSSSSSSSSSSIQVASSSSLGHVSVASGVGLIGESLDGKGSQSGSPGRNNPKKGKISPSKSLPDPPEVNNFDGISLYLVGSSGVGKTAVMAQLAAQIYEQQQASGQSEHIRNRPVVIRFCGTSEHSLRGLLLVSSVCRQIHFALGHVMDECTAVLHMSYEEAVAHLHRLLQDYPVVLLLDNLDQLSNENLARSHLTFLKGVKPHRHTRIIVSTLRDDFDAEGGSSPVIFKGALSHWRALQTHLPGNDKHSDTQPPSAAFIMHHPILKSSASNGSSFSSVSDASSSDDQYTSVSLALRKIAIKLGTDMAMPRRHGGLPGIASTSTAHRPMVEIPSQHAPKGIAGGRRIGPPEGPSGGPPGGPLGVRPGAFLSSSAPAAPLALIQNSHGLVPGIAIAAGRSVAGFTTGREGGGGGGGSVADGPSANPRHLRLRLAASSPSHAAVAADGGGNNTRLLLPIQRNEEPAEPKRTSSAAAAGVNESYQNIPSAQRHRTPSGASGASGASSQQDRKAALGTLKKLFRYRTMVKMAGDVLHLSAHKQAVPHHYGCDTKLREHGVPRLEIMPLRTPGSSQYGDTTSGGGSSSGSISGGAVMSMTQTQTGMDWTKSSADDSEIALASERASEARNMLEKLLAGKGRRLTTVQWTYVQKQLLKEPTALYLKLALRVVEKWTSTFKGILCSGVANLIGQIFRDLERNFGSVLVKTALGFITLSAEGITDSEMCDLLSLHNGVIASVNQYNKAMRLPMHVWLRLRGELSGLLVERSGGCLKWYHRQLQEVAILRFSAYEKKYLHSIMGRYFADLVPVEIMLARQVSQQRLTLNIIEASGATVSAWLSRARVNRRRCVEAGTHLLKAKMFQEAERELCSLEGVCARAKCGELFKLSLHLSKLVSALPTSTKAEHYLRWVRKDVYQIKKDPHVYVVATAAAQPLSSQVRADLKALIASEKYAPAAEFSDDVWCRHTMLGGQLDFEPTLNVLMGHTSFVRAVCFSPDGRKIASGSSDRSVRLWWANTGMLTAQYEGHAGPVTGLAFSPNGSYLASVSMDRSLRIWNTLTHVLQLPPLLDCHDEGLTGVAYRGDGALVVTGSHDKSIKVWSASTLVLCAVLRGGHFESVTSVAFSPTRHSLIFSGSSDSTVRLWDAERGKLLKTLKGHFGPVNAIAVSPDGAIIASASDDKTVRVWSDWMTQPQSVQLPAHALVQAVAFAFDSSGCKVVAGCDDHAIRVFNVSDFCLCSTLKSHMSSIRSIAWHGTAAQFVSASDDNTVRVWDLGTAAAIGLRGHSSGVQGVAFSADGLLIGTASHDKTARVWSAASGVLLITLKGHSDNVSSVVFSPDSTLLVSGSDDTTCRVWDPKKAKLLLMLKHSSGVRSIVFTPDGARILSGSSDWTLRLWDTTSGQLITRLRGHLSIVRSVAISPDGAFAVSGADDMTIRIWNLTTHKMAVHDTHTYIRSIAFSSDGARVVTGCGDKLVRVWDMLQQPRIKVIMTLRGHFDIVTCVAFTADDSFIVSCGNDRTVRLWDAYTGDLRATLRGHEGSVKAIAISPDGSQIVSGSSDETVRVWAAVSGVGTKLS